MAVSDGPTPGLEGPTAAVAGGGWGGNVSPGHLCSLCEWFVLLSVQSKWIAALEGHRVKVIPEDAGVDNDNVA